MRSMSLLLGFSIVIFVALFFGSMGKDRPAEKTPDKHTGKTASQQDERPENAEKQPSATE